MDEKGQVQVVLFLILLIPVVAAIYLFTESFNPIVQEYLDDYMDENEADTPDSGIHRLIFLFYPFAFLIVGILILVMVFKGGGS